MIWIDVATPKYAMFFARLFKELQKEPFKIIVTTRCAPNYTEAKEILDLHKIPHIVLGEYGGGSLKDKFKARIKRQNELLGIFENELPKVLLSGCVVDSVQFAYGLGIPVVNFYDTPAFDKPNYFGIPREWSVVTKLTLPLSKLVFYPFILPKELTSGFGLKDLQFIAHPFIDVALWINEIKKDESKDFRKKYSLDLNKPTILVREEEYKAHYVKQKIPTLYETIPLLREINANIVILPRYEAENLKKDFGDFALVLNEKLNNDELYPFIDLFIGGGGTMNLEAICYGIPTISTRSIWLYHDQYLIKNNLMLWSNDSKEVLKLAKENLGKRLESKGFFAQGECNFSAIINKIKEEILCNK